jgi:hypothetical protein
MNDLLRGAVRSLTLWVNGALGSIIIALPVLQANFPALEQYLGHDTYRYAMGAIVAANILLRVKTTSSLQDKGAQR